MTLLTQVAVCVLIIGVGYLVYSVLRRRDFNSVHPHAHPVVKQEVVQVTEVCRHCGDDIHLVSDQWVTTGTAGDGLCVARPQARGALPFLPHEPVIPDPGAWM